MAVSPNILKNIGTWERLAFLPEDRRGYLNGLLAAYYQLDVYSEETQVLEKTRGHGYIDYYTQMPEVFANSKVNLNISLKAICTGIPLRVIDVMGCGGFVLSNYQKEILEYMHPGVDCEVYESLEDAYYKVEFYLKNEKIREKIARNGLEQMKLIFVDDAWDKIKEIEKQYSESIIVIHCKNNGRQGRVRNIGMSYASGDYIAIVNYELYHYFVNG